MQGTVVHHTATLPVPAYTQQQAHALCALLQLKSLAAAQLVAMPGRSTDSCLNYKSIQQYQGTRCNCSADTCSTVACPPVLWSMWHKRDKAAGSHCIDCCSVLSDTASFKPCMWAASVMCKEETCSCSK